MSDFGGVVARFADAGYDTLGELYNDDDAVGGNGGRRRMRKDEGWIYDVWSAGREV